MDIKETLEVIDVLDVTAKAIKEAKADGDVDWKDSPKFVKVIPAAVKAINGADKIKLELKDLDDGETQVLFDRIMAASTALLDAIMSGHDKAIEPV